MPSVAQSPVTAVERDAVHVHDLHVVRRGILPNRLQLASEAIAFGLPLTRNPQLRVSLRYEHHTAPVLRSC